MENIPAIAIFDVGKTNKKLLLFDEQYGLLYEETVQLAETVDEDGFPCEDIEALTHWVKTSFDLLVKDKRFDIRAVNFSAYGASFVYLDEQLKVILPLYNYLKPFSPQLKEKFYAAYGGESFISQQTASLVLGNLNSGMQLYRLKYEKPEAFAKIRYALHLPQYLSFILSGELNSDITSIGCHTQLWDFENNRYHSWVVEEGIHLRLAPIRKSDEIAGHTFDNIPVGVGLHDSSAALIPYLSSFAEPFILLSSGTWCISLNPFNQTSLTEDELKQDCLCYLSYQGKPVKASRLFAGYEHEEQVKRLARHFKTDAGGYKKIKPDWSLINQCRAAEAGEFDKRNLSDFGSYEEAYHRLIADLVAKQVKSTNLVLKGRMVKKIFVDGGFSSNSLYIHMLAQAYAGIEVFAASVPQASALGAALVMHKHWNLKALPVDIIDLKLYPGNRNAAG